MSDLRVDELKKGEWISPDKCESLLSVKRDHKLYGLKLMGLGSDLERQWLESKGEVVTLTYEHEGIRICTDDEAVIVLKSRRKQNIRGLERTLTRQIGVDRARLSTNDLRNLHDRECTTGAAFLAGGRINARQAELRAHAANKPSLFPDKKNTGQSGY
jgi:hypothetical protein